MPLSFRVVATDPSSRARTGRAETDHGSFETPAFMPVGTRAAVKGMTPRDLREVGAEIVLANAFHLGLRPGDEMVRRRGGLHRFMGWDGPILTDSGGYQVFSLADSLVVHGDRVDFRSPYDGAKVSITPARAMTIQRNLGADLVMAFDQCGAYPATPAEAEAVVARTLDWAVPSRETPLDAHQAVLGIVQGGVFGDLRVDCARRLVGLDFPAYAIGGLMVGEPIEEAARVLEATVPELPAERLRYLMGVGMPGDLVMAVERGIDLFDCVIPTRHARNHQAFTSEGRLNLKNARFREDEGPLDPTCSCETCATFTRAYLSHLCREKELLGPVALTRHNLHYYQTLMRRMRQAIAEGTFAALRATFDGPALPS